ncbi:MAG TPA: polysaccharide biosynthesis/export family protein [Pyrinomonadaceae bacterium]|jgi:polysaccharide export outer membrane protein|nr:polysaccharide biosynthesis/export family protein [Pyrinomonadaceae bacterium]
MSNKKVLLATIVVGLSASFAFSQEQAQPPILGSTGNSVDSQGIRNYLLGPGDVLDVRVFGQTDLSSQVEIDSDGNVSSLPFLEQPIRAQCRTVNEVQKDIAAAYSKYIKNPQVSVRIQDRKSRPPATILGAVRNPSEVIMMREVRLHELITKAAGWTERASGTIEISHTQPLMCKNDSNIFQKATLSEKGNFGITIYKISDLKAGKEEADPIIWPGDVVRVTEGDPVYVTGAVVNPRELVLRDQLTLARAIAMAGGPQRLAKSEVHIFRQREGKPGQDDLKFNYDEIKKGKAPDPELKPFDIVDVGLSGTFSQKGFGDFLKGLVTGTSNTIIQRGIIY